MSKKVVIVSSSPRAGGNSDTLCDMFAKGAIAAGNTAEKVFLKSYNINYCTGCGYCVDHRGVCTQKDDMVKLKDKLIDADAIVLATPIYFYAMCGQMKTFIDRNCFFYNELEGKEFYYIMTAADGDIVCMDRAVEEFRGYLDCIPNAKEKGKIFGVGVWNIGDIEGKPSLTDAYNMGMGV